MHINCNIILCTALQQKTAFYFYFSSIFFRGGVVKCIKNPCPENKIWFFSLSKHDITRIPTEREREREREVTNKLWHFFLPPIQKSPPGAKKRKKKKYLMAPLVCQEIFPTFPSFPTEILGEREKMLFCCNRKPAHPIISSWFFEHFWKSFFPCHRKDQFLIAISLSPPKMRCLDKPSLETNLTAAHNFPGAQKRRGGKDFFSIPFPPEFDPASLWAFVTLKAGWRGGEGVAGRRISAKIRHFEKKHIFLTTQNFFSSPIRLVWGPSNISLRRRMSGIFYRAVVKSMASEKKSLCLMSIPELHFLFF